MIIAVDFDGTLQINNEPNIPLLRDLLQCQRNGDTVILWTCRSGKSLVEAVEFLRSYGFQPNYINSNTPQAIKIMGHDSRKIFADVYIDDKNLR